MKIYRIRATDGKLRKAIKIKCLNCKKSKILRLHKRKPKFCSLSCFNKYKIEKSRIKLKCCNCNKIIYKSRSKLLNSKHNKYFCNRRCKERAQSLKGKCLIIRPSHYGNSNGQQLYKNLIKNKKNPKCIDCKEKRKYLLVVHHIDKNNKNNKGVNLEIVCGNCHMKRHLKLINNFWRYGTRFLTPRNLLKDL